MSGEDVDIPESIGERSIAATASCVVIGTSADEATTLVLTDDDAGTERGELALTFAGTLLTPTRELMFRNVDLDSLLSIPVAHVVTEIEVWTNDPSEPTMLICRRL